MKNKELLIPIKKEIEKAIQTYGEDEYYHIDDDLNKNPTWHVMIEDYYFAVEDFYIIVEDDGTLVLRINQD